VVRAALAIDIGGTKLAAGVVDDTGALMRSATAPTRGDLFEVLTQLVAEVRGGDEVVVGVGCGGPMCKGNEIGRASCRERV